MIPAVLSRGSPGNALRASLGSFRNLSGKSQPYWGHGPPNAALGPVYITPCTPIIHCGFILFLWKKTGKSIMKAGPAWGLQPVCGRHVNLVAPYRVILQKWCNTPPPFWYLVSHRLTYSAIYRAIIVRYPPPPHKNKHGRVCHTIATSIARHEKYRCWASKHVNRPLFVKVALLQSDFCTKVVF